MVVGCVMFFRRLEPHHLTTRQMCEPANHKMTTFGHDGNFRLDAKPRLTFPIQYTADPENPSCELVANRVQSCRASRWHWRRRLTTDARIQLPRLCAPVLHSPTV